MKPLLSLPLANHGNPIHMQYKEDTIPTQYANRQKPRYHFQNKYNKFAWKLVLIPLRIVIYVQCLKETSVTQLSCKRISAENSSCAAAAHIQR